MSSPNGTPTGTPSLEALRETIRGLWAYLPAPQWAPAFKAFVCQVCNARGQTIGALPHEHTCLFPRSARLSEHVSGLLEDSARLDALSAWVKGDQTICYPGNHGGTPDTWLLSREDESKGNRYSGWQDEFEGGTLREAIDAARTATPAEERER